MNEPDQIEEIIKHFRFSPFVKKDTRQGPRMIRSAPIVPPASGLFWKTWREDKGQWYERGFSVSKDGTAWLLNQFLSEEGEVTDGAKAKAAEAREEEREHSLPADWIPDDVTLTTAQAEGLYGYQKPAVLRLKRALGIGNALDASDTGTGKTRCALVAAAELGLTPCVIAPLAVLEAWRREARAVGVRLGWVLNYDKVRTGRSEVGIWKPACEFTPGAHGQRFVFTYLPPKPLLVFDEVQKAKSAKSLQGQVLRDASLGGHKILCLSATAAKDPMEMRNLGAALGLHDGSAHAFNAFCEANGCRSGPTGMYFDKRNRGLLEKLHRKIFPLKGNRIRVADLPEFPETQILAETLTCDTEFITAAYSKAERRVLELEADSSLSKAERDGEAKAEMMRARIAAEAGKLDLFEELTSDAIEEGRSVVIFLNFRNHVQIMMDRLKTSCVVWGDQKSEDRQANIDDFQADRSRVIVISLQAGGAGLSLHDLHGNHPRLALISPSYSAIDLKQALGRVHRAGAKSKSFQRIVFAADTIEEEICRSVREKLVNIDTLNDGALAPPSILRHALPAERPHAELLLSSER